MTNTKILKFKKLFNRFILGHCTKDIKGELINISNSFYENEIYITAQLKKNDIIRKNISKKEKSLTAKLKEKIEITVYSEKPKTFKK